MTPNQLNDLLTKYGRRSYAFSIAQEELDNEYIFLCAQEREAQNKLDQLLEESNNMGENIIRKLDAIIERNDFNQKFSITASLCAVFAFLVFKTFEKHYGFNKTFTATLWALISFAGIAIITFLFKMKSGKKENEVKNNLQ